MNKSPRFSTETERMTLPPVVVVPVVAPVVVVVVPVVEVEVVVPFLGTQAPWEQNSVVVLQHIFGAYAFPQHVCPALQMLLKRFPQHF